MEGRPLYRTLAAIGFVSHLLAMLVLLLNVTEGRGFFLVVGLVDVAGAVTITRFPWGRWTGLLCAVLATLATFWLVFALTALPSVVDFFASLTGVTGYLTALVASILNLGASRREKLATRGHQRGIALVAAAIAALTALSAVLTFAAQETVPASEAAGATKVAMKDDVFVPRDFPVAPGGKVLVHNSDRIAHTFTIEDHDVDEIVTPGSETLVTVPAGLSGRVEYVCTFHSDMKGTLTVG